MAFLDDLARSRTVVTDDPNRMSMLDALQAAASDPNFQKNLTATGDAQMAVARDQAQRGFWDNDAQQLASSAQRGLLGSSASAGARAQGVAARDQFLTNAAGNIEDWQQQQLDGRTQALYQYLSQIMGPTSTEDALHRIDMNTRVDDNDLNGMMNQSRRGFNDAFSRALGTFASALFSPKGASKVYQDFNQSSSGKNPFRSMMGAFGDMGGKGGKSDGGGMGGGMDFMSMGG